LRAQFGRDCRLFCTLKRLRALFRRDCRLFGALRHGRHSSPHSKQSEGARHVRFRGPTKERARSVLRTATPAQTRSSLSNTTSWREAPAQRDMGVLPRSDHDPTKRSRPTRKSGEAGDGSWRRRSADERPTREGVQRGRQNLTQLSRSSLVKESSAAFPSKQWVLRTRGCAAQRGTSLSSGARQRPSAFAEPPPRPLRGRLVHRF
jgi:hypothetical protein